MAAPPLTIGIPVCNGGRYYLRFDEHLRVTVSYSPTIGLCETEFVKWAASDDLFHPTFSVKALAALGSRPDAVLAYTEAQVIDSSSAPVRKDDFMRACRPAPGSGGWSWLRPSTTVRKSSTA